MTETVERPTETLVGGSPRAVWVRVAHYAALALVLWAAVLQLLAGELIPPVAAIGIVFAVMAVVLAGERRRVALIAAVLGALTIVGNLPTTIDELTHPDSAVAFSLTLWAVLAAALVTFAGVAAFRGSSPASLRALLVLGSGLFLSGVIVAVVASAGVESATPLASDIQVVAVGAEFDTEEIRVESGPSGFWLENQDGIRHTFTIEGLGFEIDAPGFSAQRAEFDLAAGEYVVFCSVPGHERMRIDLVVEG